MTIKTFVFFNKGSTNVDNEALFLLKNVLRYVKLCYNSEYAEVFLKQNSYILKISISSNFCSVWEGQLERF